MEFRIIEQSSNNLPSCFDGFVEDFNQYKYTLKELMAKYDLSQRQVYRIRRLAEDKGLIRKGYYSPVPPKYYHFNRSKERFIVQRLFDNRTVYYASFRLEWEAQECVRLLEEYHWDKRYMPFIRRRINEIQH